ncbi:MAG: hypothetical protein L0H15_02910 [Nitrosospira sp.]|nr:hypothetical protein [Nitrosospira sp.]MDN5882970.1 hypothetical protein [Nitrosospira sp.]
MKIGVPFFLIVIVICSSCSRMVKPTPTLPVSSVLLQLHHHSLQNAFKIIKIDPATRDLDTWKLRPRFAQVPVRLHNNRTIKVIGTHVAEAYMDQPLCQAIPVVHARFHGFRWGKYLYEDLQATRTAFLNQLKMLIKANCAPGQVKAIQLAVFDRVAIYIHSSHNARYIDRYDEKMNGTPAGRYVYYGVVSLGENYTLVHQDPDGLERYYRTNRAMENRFEGITAIRHAERRLQKEGIGILFTDYCSANPLVCIGLAATIAASAGYSNSNTGGSNSQTFASCTAQCLSKPQMEQPTCRSLCYEFITR